MDLIEKSDTVKIKLLEVIIREVFKISLFGYLVLYFIDTIHTGFISEYFNIDIILIIAILSGTIVLLVNRDFSIRNETNKQLAPKVLSIGLSIALILMIFIELQIHSIGFISYVISFATGCIFFILFLIIVDMSPTNDSDPKIHE